jgi:hypothetical protein
MKKNKLVIISGVTGSIGQEVLRKYMVEQNTLIYGISRKGIPVSEFTVLPSHHLIVNVNLHDNLSIKEFAGKIPQNEYESITYFHLVGEFKTEITKDLKVSIENDVNNDGIDDSVYSLVANAYKEMVTSLLEISEKSHCEINIISFGSLADQHNIECFSSFRRSRELVRNFSKDCKEKCPLANFYLFNTSTMMAADEMLERPFIFSTPVNPLYWITPHELVQKTVGFMELEKGFVEEDMYLPNPHFSSDYFCNNVTYVRRVKELYNKVA